MVRFKNESNFKLMNHLLFSNGFYSRLFEVAEVIRQFLIRQITRIVPTSDQPLYYQRLVKLGDS